MQSYQNLKILKTLYQLKSLGYCYHSNIDTNQSASNIELSNNIDHLNKQIQNCFLCDLSKSRKQSMPGFGSKNAKIMFVDYKVSEFDDSSNNYFNGKSGVMLKNMITNVLQLPLENIYYTHIIKCKPFENKELTNEENSCKNYLLQQIKLINPEIIVTLGEKAYKTLTNDKSEFENIRGVMIKFENKKLFALYHPNFILRNPNKKKVLYNDLIKIKSIL